MSENHESILRINNGLGFHHRSNPRLHRFGEVRPRLHNALERGVVKRPVFGILVHPRIGRDHKRM